jgi:hypothetical protein
MLKSRNILVTCTEIRYTQPNCHNIRDTDGSLLAQKEVKPNPISIPSETLHEAFVFHFLDACSITSFI